MASTADVTPSHDTAAHRRSVVAAVVGNALEFYDFATYAFFAPVIGRTFFPAGSEWASLTLSVATFGVGFVTRPLGGIIIGAYADRAGRKPALMLTITLMALGSLMLAATPSFATIGVAAPTLVVVARLIQGFALGGDVGPATAYLIERAPAAQRGFYGSWQFASQGLSILAAGTIGVALTTSLSTAQMESWGWRVPFLCGLLIVPVGFYIRRHLPETAIRTAANTAGVLSTLFGAQRGVLALAVPVLMAATVSTYVGNYMTTYAVATLKLPPEEAIAATAIVGTCVFAFSLLAGLSADRFGRRITMLLPRVLLAVLACPAFLLMTRIPGAATLLVMSALIAALSAASGAASLVTLAELLPREVRSSGISIVYASVVAIFGGTTQLVVTWLTGITGDPLAPAYYLTATSAIGAVAMLALPETKGRPTL